jgi:hypothetical protein
MLVEDVTFVEQRQQDRAVLSKLHERLRLAQFRAVQNMWRSAIKFFYDKITYFNLCDLSCRKCAQTFINVEISFYDSLYDDLTNFEIKKSILWRRVFSYFLHDQRARHLTQSVILNKRERLLEVVESR